MEIAHDRAKVCELLMKGYRSVSEIASIINENRPVEKHISDGQIRNDIEFMKNQYLERGLENFHFYRNQLEDEINFLKKTFYHGYELSRRSKVTLESDKLVIEDEDMYDDVLDRGLDIDGDENNFQRVARVKEEKRLEGNPAFLQGVRDCIDRLAKLYGVDAPNKVALTDVTGQNDAIDVGQLLKDKIDQIASRTSTIDMKTIDIDAKEVKQLND